MKKDKKGNTGHLMTARKNKNNEFYTMYKDIEKEIKHYKESDFENKNVFLNCDDYRLSNFYQYMKDNFKRLKVREVNAIHRKRSEHEGVWHARLYLDNNGVLCEMVTDVSHLTDGDFRGEYSNHLLEQSDLVITNPPFSLVREFITLMFKKKKDVLIIVSQNAVTYKEVFPHITDGVLRSGVTGGTMEFVIPDEHKDNKNAYYNETLNRYCQSLGNIMWLTTLSPNKKPQKLNIVESYVENKDNYPTYYNLDGIEVGKVADIPYDYDGLMGVPITYLTKHNPEQFEIIGHARDEKFEVDKPRLLQFRDNKNTEKTVSTKGDLYRPLKPNEKEPMLTYKDAEGNTYRRVYSRYIIRKVQ